MTSKKKSKIRISCQNFFACCKSTMEADELAWESFEKDFTEYEYVIENARIRPVPKKLLEIAQVHKTLTDASTNVTYKTPTTDAATGDIVKMHHLKRDSSVVNLTVTDRGEPPERTYHVSHTRPQSPRPIFMSENKTQGVCGPCHPSSPNYNPCQRKFVPEERPCLPCRTGLFSSNCRPLTEEDAQDIVSKPLYEKTTTPIQILKDIADASADGLRIKKAFRSEYIPSEIREVIDTLKVIKPDTVKPHKVIGPFEDITQIRKQHLQRAASTAGTTETSVTDYLRPEDFTGTEFLPQMNAEELIMKCCASAKKRKDTYTETDEDETNKEKGRLKWKIVISKHSKGCGES